VIQCVIFDMDDTLYDEIEYYKSGLRAVADAIASQTQAIGAAEVYDVLWGVFSSGNHTTTFNETLETLKIDYDETFIKTLVLTIRRHPPAIKLPQQTEAVLDELQNSYKLALLTDGFMPAQRLKVQALGIEKYFEHIIYTEELGREFWKPSHVGFEKIFEQLTVAAQNCVYIADNPKKDFIAPNKLGCTTIQITRPNHMHFNQAPNKHAKPAHVIYSLDRLPQLLKDI